MRSLFTFIGLIFGLVVFGQPIADFGATTTSGCGLVQTVFVDSSKINGSPIAIYKWDIAGVISDKPSPGRIFDKPGKYKICLTVTDASGKSNTKCKEDFIVVYAKPSPEFVIDVNKGCSPVTVNFTDKSKTANGKIINWLWDIGGSANVINTQDGFLPIKSVYTFGGSYSMSLTIKDEKGCEATISKKDIVYIDKVPNIGITKKFLQSCTLPWKVLLTNSLIDPNASYTWDFGNGSSYIGANPPEVVFDKNGSYDLSVIVKKNECKDTFLFEGYVDTDPKMKIKTDKDAYCLGESVSFKDDSDIGADSLVWHFGNGSISKEKAPIYTYNQEGCFNVKLYRYRNSCIDSVFLSCLKVITAKKPAIAISNQFTCNVPVTIGVSALAQGSYDWSINTSPAQMASGNNVNFTINKFGKYKVYLSYKNPQGCTLIDSNEVKIEKFEANLPGLFVGGCVPYEVSLDDSIVTSVPITKYEWTIGNTSNPIHTSTAEAPKFLLNTVGEYPVRLIATNIFGCKDTVVRQGYVQGGTPPTADLIAAPLNDCLIQERTFNAISSANADSWQWYFGDDSPSMFGKETKHSYTMPGSYDVTVVAYHNGCPTSKTYPDLIKVLEPVSSYKINFRCDDPYTIDLQNLSIGADSLYWTIYNGTTTDTLRDSILTSYTFPTRGKFTMGIYSKSFDTGCEHIRLDTIIITDPIAKFKPDTIRGCMPLQLSFNNESIDAVSSKFYFGANDTLSSNTFEYKKSGKYKLPNLMVTDLHGCKDSITYDSITVLVNQALAKIDYKDIICVPQVNILKSKSIDSFANIISYQWAIGSTTATTDSIQYNFDKAGLFDLTLRIEDDWGCTDSITLIQAVEAIELKPDFISDSLGCTNLEMIFIPQGDNVNTSKYLWTFGDGSTDSLTIGKHKYTSEGSFEICLTLEDRRGCQNQTCKPNHIDIKDVKAAFEGSPRSETCPPLLTNFVNKSNNAIAYEWSFGDNSGFSFVKDPGHVYLEPDSFDVRLIAIRSEVCRDTIQYKDYITVYGPRGKFETKTIGNCLPLEVAFKASSDDYYTYTWDFGNGQIDTSTLIQNSDEFVYTYMNTGVFTPKLIIADNFGCMRSFSSDIIEVNKIDFDIAIQNPLLCGLPANSTITNNSSSSSANFFFTWQVAHDLDTTIYNQYDLSMSLDQLGSYHITAIGSSENCMDTANTNFVLEVNPKPLASFEAVDSLCTLNSSKAINTSTISQGTIKNFVWKIEDKIVNATNVDLLMTKPGIQTIKLIAESDKACRDSVEKSIVVVGSPTATLGMDTLICKGDKIDIYINNFDPSDHYTWYEQGVAFCDSCTSIIRFPQSTVSYQLYAFNDDGCSITDTMRITVAPLAKPIVDLGKDSILCKGIEARLYVQNYLPSLQYEWLSYDASACIDDCKGLNITIDEATSVTIKATNQYGCFSYDTLSLTVEASVPDFLINEKYICEDATTELKIDSIAVMSWSDRSKILCTDCPKITIVPDQDAYYFAKVKSINNCIYVDSILVKQVPYQSIDAGQEKQLCLGETYTTQSMGIGLASWSFDGIALDTGSTAILHPKASGYYVVSYTKDECTLKDSLLLDVIVKASIQAQGDTVCFGDVLTLTADGLAEKYEWQVNNATIGQGNKINYNSEEPIWIDVIGSRTTCQSDTSRIMAFVHPKIEYDLLENEYLLYYNTKQTIKAQYDLTNDYSYQWSPSTGLSCDDCPTPTIANLDESHLYLVEVKDNNSECAIELEAEARLKEECSPEGFFIPNIMDLRVSQNENQFFVKSNYPEDFISVQIFDRWGNGIFKSEDINFIWDGRFNGDEVSTGVYIYLVTAVCPQTGHNYSFGGDVTIIK